MELVKVDRLIVLLCAISFAESLGYSIVLPIVPYIAQKFAANEIIIGTIFAVYSICQLITAPLIGSLSDRIGRKPLLLISQATTVAGFLVLGLADSLFLVFLSRIIDGISAGNVSLLYTAVADKYPADSRSRYFGLLATFSGLGVLGGPVLGSVLGTQNLGLPAFVALVLALLVLAGSFLWLPETHPPEKQQRRESNSAQTGQEHGESPGGFRDLLKDSGLRRLLELILISNTILNAFLLTFPVFMQKSLNTGLNDIGGIITGLFLIAAVYQILILQKLLASAGDWRAALVGFGLCLSGFGILLVVKDLAGILLAGGLVMWGLATLNAVLPAFLTRRAQASQEGLVLGLNQTIASVGQIVGPLVGYATLFFFSNSGLILTCLLMAGAGLGLLFNRRFYH